MKKSGTTLPQATFYEKLSKLWKPILVADGEIIPLFYGAVRYAPYHKDVAEPNFEAKIYCWRKVMYPFTVSWALSLYYWAYFKLRRGFCLPPESYRTQYFKVYRSCPYCQKDLYGFDPKL